MPTIDLIRPHAGQLKVISEAARFNTLRCGRRFGKTTLAEILATESILKGLPVGWFAPTYKLLDEPWRDMVRILKPITKTANKTDKRIETIVPGGIVDFWTLDSDDPARGRKYGRVIVDEAGIVRELESAWNGAIRPTLADLRGDAWFLGTPKGKGYFSTLYAKGQGGHERWKAWQLGTAINPAIAQDELDEARRDMPADIYAQEFEGVPVESNTNPFGIDAIRRCIKDLSVLPVKVWGIDLASSQDWTVAIGLDQGGQCVRFERWQGPWNQTIERLQALIGDAEALVDDTGVGKPVVEQLATKCRNIEGFTFTGPSKQELMGGLAVAIQRGTVAYPAGVIVNELEMFDVTYLPQGRVRYEAPPGLHDDCVMALALAYKKLAYTTYGVSGPAFHMI